MTEEQIQYLPLDRIECRLQVRQRFDEDTLLGLARSIQETDRVLQPIRVRRDNGAFVVVDGERRVRAARKLGLPTVPVIIEDKELCEAEVLHRQLVLDCQKEHLTAVERAKAIQALMQESGWTASQVAQHVGISPATVTKLLAVLELPDEVQEQVATGALGMSTAYAIAHTGDAETKAALISDATNGRVTRERVAERTRSRKSKRRSAARGRSRAQGDRCVIPLGEDCSLVVGNPTITLQYVSLILQDLLKRIGGLAQDMQMAEAAQALARKESFP